MSGFGVATMRRSAQLALVLAVLVLVLGSAMSASAVFKPVTVKGRVVDQGKSAEPKGIAGLKVFISGGTDDPNVAGYSQEATTNATGYYDLPDIIQGSYSIFVPDTNAFSQGYTSDFNVVSGQTPKVIADIKLARNGVISGRCLSGSDPVAGVKVSAQCEIAGSGDWWSTEAISKADGTWSIPNAPLGSWTIKYQCDPTNQKIPADAVPTWYQDAGTGVCQSLSETFVLTSGNSPLQLNKQFVDGARIWAYAQDAYAGTGAPYFVSDVWVYLTNVDDPSIQYMWWTGEDGFAPAVVPAGTYTLRLEDVNHSIYSPGAESSEIVLTSGGADTFRFYGLVPDPSQSTYLLTGLVRDASSGAALESARVDLTSDADPGNQLMQRTVHLNPDISDPAAKGRFLVRLPAGPDNPDGKYRADVVDLGNSHLPQIGLQFDATAGDVSTTVDLQRGGTLTGTVRDEAGNPVPGVSVWADHMEPGESWWGSPMWAQWWTRTNDAGVYSISGLQTDSDYRVRFAPYYDEGEPLPVAYKDYTQVTYLQFPSIDSLENSETPIVANHTPVAVTQGSTTSNIDATIVPGGHAEVAANNGATPMGSVYNDLFYNVAGNWIEVDSGYTKGGLWQKLWKPIPAGDYHLHYKDYFGRVSGEIDFSLAQKETRRLFVNYNGTLPVNLGTSVGAKASASVRGAANLPADAGVSIVSAPTTITAVPKGSFVPANAAFDVKLPPTGSLGTNTQLGLTLPYDPTIPDSDVAALRVLHYPSGGGAATTLKLRTFNTANHTVTFDTPSLSTFQLFYTPYAVKMTTPAAPSRPKRWASFTISGDLKPRHTAGKSSVQIRVYQLKSHKWVKIKTLYARNYNKSTYTQYRSSLKLGKGSYRLYAYAAADKYHAATLTSYRAVSVR